ncbi:MAG: glycerate kinase [Oscillospiraceae bacterium]|nr:glycerate kinase [Oscillospiraceae bacterium]
MKFLLIPDSFKGTLSSEQICGLLRESIRAHFPQGDTVSIPVADGGDGSVDAFLTALGGEKRYLTVKNPFFEDMEAYYGLIDSGETAVIEMAACAGLPLAEGRRDPRITTTYGVGQLMTDAAKQGVKRIIMGLGGSATNDAGCGAAAAAGVRFYKASGEQFIPTGGTLCEVADIDLSGLDEAIKGVEIVTMCDIDNPMYGPNGAAYIFAPQKGADPETVKALDDGLRHLAGVMAEKLGADYPDTPGAGAAGAMGMGMLVFFGSRLQMGIQTVLDVVKFEELAADCDYVITGEGKLDSQSLRGKVVIGVAQRAKALDKPVIAIVGGAEDAQVGEAYDIGVTAVFPINRLPQDFSVSRYHSEDNLRYTADNMMRLLAAEHWRVKK